MPEPSQRSLAWAATLPSAASWNSTYVAESAPLGAGQRTVSTAVKCRGTPPSSAASRPLAGTVRYAVPAVS